jgi:hypothetical protein
MKLTSKDYFLFSGGEVHVIEIRKLLKNGMPQKKIGLLFGVCAMTINGISKGKIYVQ